MKNLGLKLKILYKKHTRVLLYSAIAQYIIFFFGNSFGFYFYIESELSKSFTVFTMTCILSILLELSVIFYIIYKFMNNSVKETESLI